MTTAEDGARPTAAPRGRSRLRTREQLLDAALHLIDTEGVHALTIRRLAADLGIGVTTVYGYVRTKEEILDEVTRLALQPLYSAKPDGRPWQQELRERILSLYRALRSHPGATQVLASGQTPGPIFDEFREHALALLREAGFRDREAVRSLHALYSYTVGFAATAGHAPVPARADADRLSALPVGRFPVLADVAEEFSYRFADDSFEFGLDRILAGLSNPRSADHSSRGV